MSLQRVSFSLLLLFCGFTASLADNITIDENTFPDAAFRDYVTNTLVKASSFDSDDVSSYTTITLNNANITNVKGIEYFTALTTLDLSNCSIEEIDLSKNVALRRINVNNNQLKELDLSANKSVTRINAENNHITKLNVSGCTWLFDIYANNNQLTELDLSNNSKIVDLELNNSKISKLDLRQMSNLENLYASNCNLTEVLMPESNNTIDNVDLSNNKIKSIDLSGCSGLNDLNLNYNQLTELDVSFFDGLTHLYCSHNQLGILKLPPVNEDGDGGVRELDCSYNNLRTIDVSTLTNTRLFSFSNNKLTSLDLSSAKTVIEDDEYKFTPSISAQSDTLGLSLDGTQVSFSVPEGFDKTYVSNLTLTAGRETADWTDNLTAGTAADNMLPLLFPENFYSSVRKTFFNYDSSTGKASPMLFTYDYNTQSTSGSKEGYVDLRSMDVTIKVASYLMPVGVAEADDASRYASVCLPYAFTVPTGATAYGITAVSNGEAELQTVAKEGGTVAANEPVVLMTGSDTKAVALNISSAEGSKLSGNLLRSSGSEGVTFATSDAANYWVLGLSSDTQEPGFWHPSTKYATDGNITIGPWRVYIDASSLSSTEASAKGFSLSNTGDDTTGINGVETSAKASAGNHWYTLSGTRLKKAPTRKGVYIHQGRKVVVR